MCGIVGLVNIGEQDNLENMLSTLNHRGPDNSNYIWFNNQNIGFGHTRLAIIDLSSSANQPMSSEDEQIILTYNGEIYNYKEVRKTLKKLGYSFKTNSDTEVLLKSYIHWGKDCLNFLNGMFAFAIFNKKTNKIFAARDHLGIKPFYYTLIEDNGLIFASEIKAILAAKIQKQDIDFDAIYTPVHFQVSYRTGFKNIFKLLAGHYIEYDVKTNRMQINKYWDINFKENDIKKNNDSESEIIRKLDYLINDSVKIQMESDVPVGILLSGGLDSSLIASIMRKHTKKEIHSFTIKFSKNDSKIHNNVDDSYYAKLIADKFKFIHHEIIVSPNIFKLLDKMIYHMDEPNSDPAAINSFLISQEARKHGIKVLLSGIGADEIFAGYKNQLACLKLDTYQTILPTFIQRPIKSLINLIPVSLFGKNIKYLRWIKAVNRFANLPKMERYLSSANSALNEDNFNFYYKSNLKYSNSFYFETMKKYFNSSKKHTYLTKMCYCDTKVYMTDHNLLYTDRSSMAASVEIRPPLIDYRIVDYIFQQEDKFRINGNTQKYILKKVAEKYLPYEVIYRPKAPFSMPMRSWIKNDLKESIDDVLSKENIERRGIYNYQYIHNLIHKNKIGSEDNSQIIWRLFVNELWFKKFFD